MAEGVNNAISPGPLLANQTDRAIRATFRIKPLYHFNPPGGRVREEPHTRGGFKTIFIIFRKARMVQSEPPTHSPTPASRGINNLEISLARDEWGGTLSPASQARHRKRVAVQHVGPVAGLRDRMGGNSYEIG